MSEENEQARKLLSRLMDFVYEKAGDGNFEVYENVDDPTTLMFSVKLGRHGYETMKKKHGPKVIND